MLNRTVTVRTTDLEELERLLEYVLRNKRRYSSSVYDPETSVRVIRNSKYEDYKAVEHELEYLVDIPKKYLEDQSIRDQIEFIKDGAYSD